MGQATGNNANQRIVKEWRFVARSNRRELSRFVQYKEKKKKNGKQTLRNADVNQ